MRTCGYCQHSELSHFGFECSILFGSMQCGCLGFTAREVKTAKEAAEYCNQADERLSKRGQIGDTQALDEYSAIKEHLAEIMEKASQ